MISSPKNYSSSTLIKLFLPLFISFLCGSSLTAQEISYPEKSARKSSFELKIEGVPAQKGEIRIAVFNSEQNYSSKEDPVHAIVLPVDGEYIVWNSDTLAYGDYAIAVYHDENTNGELDTNILGIPKEAYGFSNNARGKFGPASWNDARFEVNAEKTNMTIKVK